MSKDEHRNTGAARRAGALRLLGGLQTEEIARAFLVPEPTVAQRIVRAKRTLAAARVPFEVRLGAVVAGFAAYLIVKRSVFVGVLVGGGTWLAVNSDTDNYSWTGGGLIGRNKYFDNGSPLPRDRVYFFSNFASAFNRWSSVSKAKPTSHWCVFSWPKLATTSGVSIRCRTNG